MSSPSDAFFAGLTHRQSMLLLVASAFGGSKASLAFEHLPDLERDLLQEGYAKLSTIPREKRVPFLIQEIKRLMVGGRWSDMPAVDARVVASTLESERPAVTEVILRALPSSMASEVRRHLGAPPSKPGREVAAEVLSVVRQCFERQLDARSPRATIYLFSDVVSLSSRELMVLAHELGAQELGPILAGLPAKERQAFLAGIPASERLACLRNASSAALSGELQSRKELDELAHGDKRHVVRTHGMRLLARASLGQSVELASRLIERHRDHVRRLLIHAVRLERAAGRPREPEGLQRRVVEHMERLLQLGLIEPPSRRQSQAGARSSRRLPPTLSGDSSSRILDLPPVPPPPPRRAQKPPRRTSTKPRSG